LVNLWRGETSTRKGGLCVGIARYDSWWGKESIGKVKIIKGESAFSLNTHALQRGQGETGNFSQD